MGSSGLYWSAVMSSRGEEANGTAAVVDGTEGRSEISLWGSAPLALVSALRAHMHLRPYHCIKWTRLMLPSVSLHPSFFSLLSCFFILEVWAKGFFMCWVRPCSLIMFPLTCITTKWNIWSIVNDTWIYWMRRIQNRLFIEKNVGAYLIQEVGGA